MRASICSLELLDLSCLQELEAAALLHMADHRKKKKKSQHRKESRMVHRLHIHRLFRILQCTHLCLLLKIHLFLEE